MSWGWSRPWRGLNLSRSNRVPDARLVTWDGGPRSRWARDRVHDWWRSLAGRRVEVTAQQTAWLETSVPGRRTFDPFLGSWGQQATVVSTWARDGHLRLVLSPGGETEVEAERIDLDLRLGVLRAYTRVGRVLWVRLVGTSWLSRGHLQQTWSLPQAFALAIPTLIEMGLQPDSAAAYLTAVRLLGQMQTDAFSSCGLDLTLSPVEEDFSASLQYCLAQFLQQATGFTGYGLSVQAPKVVGVETTATQKLGLGIMQATSWSLEPNCGVYASAQVNPFLKQGIGLAGWALELQKLTDLGQASSSQSLEVQPLFGLGQSPHLHFLHIDKVYPIYSTGLVLPAYIRQRLSRHVL